MKKNTDGKIEELAQESKNYEEIVSKPLDRILDEGERVAKDLTFRLKDSEKLTNLITRNSNSRQEYY